MQEVNTIILENNIEYMIVDELLINNIKYIYLSNIKNPRDFCIRKEKENGILVGLDDKIEFDKALLTFTKKHS